MTLTMFECFIAAMETLNFTTAAQSIHITQPAFSRNIASLEEEIGFKLFVRSKQNGLRVTPAGLEFYNGVIKLWSDFEILKDRSTRINRGEEGKLVVGIINGVCVDGATMTTIHRFQEKYPKVEITLRCYPLHQMIQSVEQGECDICFTIGSAVQDIDTLLSEDVFMIDNYLVIPASIKCDPAKEHSLIEFKDQCFLLSEDAPKLNELLVDICRKAGFEPKTLMAPDYETKMLWTEFGKGISISSSEHFLKNSSFVDFVKVKELGADGYSMIWQRDNYNPAIALFYSMFGEIMSS